LKKQNAYRVLVNQLPGTGTLTEQTAYCQNLLNNGQFSLVSQCWHANPHPRGG